MIKGGNRYYIRTSPTLMPYHKELVFRERYMQTKLRSVNMLRYVIIEHVLSASYTYFININDIWQITGISWAWNTEESTLCRYSALSVRFGVCSSHKDSCVFICFEIWCYMKPIHLVWCFTCNIFSVSSKHEFTAKICIDHFFGFENCSLCSLFYDNCLTCPLICGLVTPYDGT